MLFMRYLRTFISIAVFAFPSIALAAAPQTWSDLVNLLVGIMNSGIGILVALAIVFYFYGMYSNILKFGENDVEKKKAYFFWGIIVLFVMVSVWGILALVRNTIFGVRSASSLIYEHVAYVSHTLPSA